MAVYLTLGQKEDYAIDPHYKLNKLLLSYPGNIQVNYMLSNQYDHYTKPLDALSNGLRWYLETFRRSFSMITKILSSLVELML